MSDNAVIVIGGGINSLGIIRNIGRIGIDVISIVDKVEYSGKSRFCRSVVINPNLYKDTNSLIETLQNVSGKFQYHKYILMPVSDGILQLLALNMQKLHSKFLLNIPDVETVDTLIDKGKFYSLLRELKIPHPKAFFPNHEESLESLSGKLSFPMFLKPNKSHEFRARFNGKKGFTINNLSELREKINLTEEFSIQVMLNEIIPGHSNNHYFIDGYCDVKGEPKAIFARRRIHMYPLDWGNSTSMVSISPDQIKPAINDLNKLLRKLNYHGIFSAEVKFDDRDNTYKFIEINARSWWYNMFPSICGINIVKMLYDDLALGYTEKIDNYKENKYHVYFWPEFLSLTHMIMKKENKILDLLREVKFSISSPLFAFDDMKPFIRNLFEWSVRKIENQFKFNY